MQKKIITEYQHKKGLHCGSTSTSNILNYYGITLCEDMCFGLGSGIGFEYHPIPGFNPPLYVGGRTSDLEVNLLGNLQIDIKLNSGNDYENIFENIKKIIDDNKPVIVWVDTFYLPYFKTQYHFPMHRVVVIGYDDEKQIVYISDNERDDIQKVNYENFKKARISTSLPIPTENKWYEIEIKKDIKPLNVAIKDALKLTYKIMLETKSENSGIKGMKKFAEELSIWDKIFGNNWVEAAKFTYLMFEKFGTGGGNFRFIYSRFLEKIKLNSIASEYKEIAQRWQNVSNLIKDAGKENNFEKMIIASDEMKKIVESEENIYSKFHLIEVDNLQ